jgi:hypothetical protein
MGTMGSAGKFPAPARSSRTAWENGHRGARVHKGNTRATHGATHGATLEPERDSCTWDTPHERRCAQANGRLVPAAGGKSGKHRMP